MSSATFLILWGLLLFFVGATTLNKAPLLLTTIGGCLFGAGIALTISKKLKGGES